MDQQHFNFGRVPDIRRIETPVSRANDPESSHIAADTITSSGRRQTQIEIIIEAVYAHPGCTAGELSRHTGLTHVQIDRRTGDLRATGRVHFGAIRACRVIGSLMQTLWPTEAMRLVA
jgi:hypothetical protein